MKPKVALEGAGHDYRFRIDVVSTLAEAAALDLVDTVRSGNGMSARAVN